MGLFYLSVLKLMDVYRRKKKPGVDSYIQNSSTEFGILNYLPNIHYQHRNMVSFPNPLATSLGVSFQESKSNPLPSVLLPSILMNKTRLKNEYYEFTTGFYYTGRGREEGV